MTTKIRIDEVRQYLLENMDETRQIVSELNGWNGSLEYLEIYENDEDFFETFFEGRPMEAVRASHYGDYSYNDDYVRFNGYGNLESFDDYQYEQKLKDSLDDIIDNLISEQAHVDFPEELDMILNPDNYNDEEPEEDEEEEEEEE